MKDRQPSPADVADEPYELDLEEDASSNIEEAIEEAVAAVERNDGKIEVVIDDEEDGDGSTAARETNDSPEQPADEEAERRIEELQNETAELRDRLARTLADFDNFRKRNERERASLRDFAVSEALEDFLGIVDNLERAINASGSVEDLKQGVQMIQRLFEDTFRRHGVEKIACVGEPFDPTRHEAVSKTESSEVEQPTVTAELQPGYMFRDRLMRPAMVSVAMPASGGVATEDSESSEPVDEPA